MLEAMSVGTPVVASNVGGNTEAIENERSGFLVPPNDYSALANATLQVLLKKDIRERIIGAAKERVSCFSIESMVKGHQELYLELAKN